MYISRYFSNNKDLYCMYIYIALTTIICIECIFQILFQPEQRRTQDEFLCTPLVPTTQILIVYIFISRYCSNNKDWSILALQNIRTGKAHYLVICQCPKDSSLGKFFYLSQIKNRQILGCKDLRIKSRVCGKSSVPLYALFKAIKNLPRSDKKKDDFGVLSRLKGL